MLIVSQNKEKVLWFGRAFNALEYSEQVNHKGKKETVRHTICISDGCLEDGKKLGLNFEKKKEKK